MFSCIGRQRVAQNASHELVAFELSELSSTKLSQSLSNYGILLVSIFEKITEAYLKRLAAQALLGVHLEMLSF